jgi:sensor histidine kinase YesM
MKYNKYNLAHKWIKIIAIPLASFIICTLWSQFFWNEKDFLYSTTIISIVNIIYFLFPYLYGGDWIINKGSVSSLVVFTIIYIMIFALINILIFGMDIVSLPYPFNTYKFPFTFLISILIIIGLTIYLAALSLHLVINALLLSFESFGLLQKNYQSEVNALRQQMNPHFISNALNNLRLIIRNKDKVSALKYNNELMVLLDEQLKYINVETIFLKDELHWIKDYLKMEQLRMNNIFNYEIIIHDNELYEYKIPIMILQPLIENSIIHGFNPKEFKGTGRIQITLRKKIFNGIHIIISDNGLGSNALTTSNHKNRPSIGSENINKRIVLINEIGEFYIRMNRKLSPTGTVCELIIDVNII